MKIILPTQNNVNMTPKTNAFLQGKIFVIICHCNNNLCHKGGKTMATRNGYVRIERLHDLSGRIDYVTSHERQEHLFGSYKTVNDRFWKILRVECQQEFRFLNHSGKCVEAKELVIALPELFLDFNLKEILKDFTEAFKNRYHVECISGMHHNKTENNLHIHLIFSERRILPNMTYTYAEKTHYYDENGKSWQSKKAISDENGNIRTGCKIIRKGDLIKRNLMSAKDPRFQKRYYRKELVHMYVDLINTYIDDPQKQLHVYDPKGPYLPTKKYGKRNPKENEIKDINQLVREWNRLVDSALDSNITYLNLCKIKHTEITEKVSQSLQKYDKDPSRYVDIVSAAIILLRKIVREINHFLSLQALIEKIEKLYKEIKNLQNKILPDLQQKICKFSGFFNSYKRKKIKLEIDKANFKIKENEKVIYQALTDNGYNNIEELQDDYDSMVDYCLYYTSDEEYDEE